MLRLKSDGFVNGFAAWLYYILLFPVRMGQQGQEKSLHQEGMAKACITYAWTEKCCTSPPVNSDMSILPSLHKKLVLFKKFVKALNKNGAGFYYLKEKFPCVILKSKKEFLWVSK